MADDKDGDDAPEMAAPQNDADATAMSDYITEENATGEDPVPTSLPDDVDIPKGGKK